jgi:hypothetical protein
MMMPFLTKTEPMGIPPSANPFLASSIASCMNESMKYLSMER